ncbi:MAG: hypothetical protein ACT4PZ_19135 [Panacagrimonas sp.]
MNIRHTLVATLFALNLGACASLNQQDRATLKAAVQAAENAQRQGAAARATASNALSVAKQAKEEAAAARFAAGISATAAVAAQARVTAVTQQARTASREFDYSPVPVRRQ